MIKAYYVFYRKIGDMNAKVYRVKIYGSYRYEVTEILRKYIFFNYIILKVREIDV